MSEPLSVEYAKSGKSGCKGCKNNIAKGELRLGFVGKANFGATAWYHYDCLWNDYENLKAVDSTKPAKTLVKGYSEVGKEDQHKLDKELPKYCKIAVEKSAQKAAEAVPKCPIAAEYAKSAKSSCKGCSENISKGVLRLGFPGKANFGATAWYHYDCLWKDYENLRPIDSTKPAKSIVDGYGELEAGDKKRLEEDLPKACKAAKSAKPAAQFPMAVEYAKSDKSSCKGCSKSIAKGVVRVGFTGKANFGATAWCHTECLSKIPADNFSCINTYDSIKSFVCGFEELKNADQKRVEEKIREGCGGKTGDKRKSGKTDDEPLPAKKAK